MANTHFHKDERCVAFFVETTAGSGPSDWGDDSTRIEFTEADFSGITTDWQIDPRQESDWERLGQRALVKGLKNLGTASVTTLLTGNGATSPSDGNSPSQVAIGTLISHCLGGSDIGTSHDATGGSTTTVQMAAITGLEEGCMVGVQDLTSPSAEHTGRVFIRRILSFTGTTANLDEALPFTVAAGDLLVGGITLFIDPDVLVDSTGATGRTLSWYHAGASSEDVLALYGCVANLSFTDLARNTLPKIGLEIMPGNWATSPTVSKDNPTTASGVSGSIIGRHTSLWVEDYGTTTSTKWPCSALEVTTGVQRSRIEAVTALGVNFEGMAGYSATAGIEATMTATITTFTDDWEADIEAGTVKVARYACESSPGSSWAIMFPKARVRSTPVRTESGDVMGNQLTLLACQDATNGDADTAALWESKILVFLC